MNIIPVALTIAGSDSGGGAGIQADLRTFSFHCVHGTSVVTCVTAQNTIGVTRVDGMSVPSVVAQIEALMDDISIAAVKTGMLLNGEIIEAVVEQVKKYNLSPLVVDPVMVSRTGSQLLDSHALSAIKEMLLPQATIVTPNRYEAQLLTGMEINTIEEMKKAAQEISDLGASTVLVKGGAMKGALKGVDIWFDGNKLEVLSTTMVTTKNTHGTGCTLSAAITANLALGKNLNLAVKEAKNYVTEALQYSLDIGEGTGPIGHFFPLLLKKED